MFKKGKLPIKESYLLIIIIVGVLSLSMYSSFALFSLEKTTSNDIVTMRAANNIETNINVYEYKTVTVDANSNLAVMVNVKNTTSDSIYYGVYYENAPVGVRVTKIDWSENNATGNISGNTTLPVELMIINDTNSSVTINIGVAGGNSNELGLPDGKILVTEEFDTGAFYNTLPTMDDSDVEIKYDANNITYFKDLVTCTDNGSGCKIVLVRPSSTKDLTAGEHTILYVLENNDGYRVKFNKKINLKSGTSTNAVELITKKNDNSTGDSGSGVYKVTHSAIPASSSATGSEIPAVTDYRYYGPSPNNYICLDMEGGSTCPDKHLYRIIGSIYEEKENTNRIKVIKATPLTDGTTKGFSWDYKVNNGSGSYDNIWATITSGNYSNSLTSGSQLMKLLNSGAWWNGTSGSYYNSTTATTVNFTNYKLSDKAKSYITTSRYYLGGYNTTPPLTNEVYGYERGTLRYNTDGPLYWEGMVGLMYPSDYGYAAGNTCVTGTKLYDYNDGCKNKDWLHISNTTQWLMSPISGGSNYAFIVNSSGFVVSHCVYYARTSRPTFYLSKDVIITGGTGTELDPYIASK